MSAGTRRRRAVHGLVVVTMLVLSGCASNPSGQGQAGAFTFSGTTKAGEILPLARRAAAPAFSGERLDGGRFHSTSLAENVVVINFWGSWCPPCRVETPDLQAVYADLRDQGVQFLGIDVKDDRQLASAFVEDVGAQYPSLFDPRDDVALAFRGFPPMPSRRPSCWTGGAGSRLSIPVR